MLLRDTYLCSKNIKNQATSPLAGIQKKRKLSFTLTWPPGFLLPPMKGELILELYLYHKQPENQTRHNEQSFPDI